tara:strand:+ start:13196 stop:19981 length:6786 start_codon:yes stop_codon:yes gene_type:complete
MYILDGNTISLQQLQNFANEKNTDVDTLLQTLPGLEEVRPDTTINPTTQQEDDVVGPFGLPQVDVSGGEKDTAIERTFGKNFVTDYFGDLYRAGAQGLAQGRTVDEAFDVFKKGENISDEELQRFIDVNNELKRYGASDEMKEYEKIKNEAGGGVWGFMKGMVMTRGQVLPQVIVSSAAGMARSFFDSEEVAASTGVGVAAGSFVPLVGSIGGAVAGLTGAMETSLTFAELLQEKLDGKEFNKENVRAILENKEMLNDIKYKSLARGGAIGAIEGVTLGLSRGVAGKLTKAGIGKGKVARTVTGIEMTGGATGEAVGQVAAGQEFDIAEVLMEGVAEGKGLVNVADILAKKEYKINNKEANKKQILEIVNDPNIKPEDLSNIKFSVTGDINLENLVKIKQNDAALETQIDKKITDTKDRKELVELEKQRIVKEREAAKKGIEKVPNAPEELAEIQANIDEIIGKYEGAVEFGQTTEAKKAAKDIQQRRISDTIELLKESNKIKNVKAAFTVENSKEATDTYKKLQEQYGLADKDVSNADGFFVPTKDGNIIVINKDVAGKKGQINVGGHELLHAVTQEHYNSLDDAGKRKFIGDFKKTLSKNSFTYVENIIKERNKGDENLDLDTTDEWLNIYSDGIIKNKITYDESMFTKFKNFLHNVFRKFGYEKEFSSGVATYNFMRDYNKNIKEGRISARAQAVAGTTAVEGEAKGSVTPERRAQIEQDVKDIGNTYRVEGGKKTWDAGGADIAITEIKENKYFDDLIAATYKADVVPKDFVSKVYSELTSHIKRFNPEENDNLFAYINSQVRNKAGNVYNREYKQQEELKGAKDIGARTKEGAPVVQVADETATQQIEDIDKTVAVTDKARELNQFDVELEDGLVEAEINAEVESLLQQNPNDLDVRLKNLVKKDIRKKLDNAIGKIRKVKGKVEIDPEYETFIRKEYNEIVKSLSITQIRTTYKNLFDREKIGVEDVKKVDAETGKTTYFRKGKFINKVNKPKFIKYFTQGGFTTIRERRNSLLTRIAERKVNNAVDAYIEENSKDLDAVTKAKFRQLSNTAENLLNEQKSFDAVKFSKSLEQRTEELFETGDFSTRGNALEQAIIELIESYGISRKFIQPMGPATEKGGVADIRLKIFGRELNLEIKMDDKVPMGQILLSSLDFNNFNVFEIAKEGYESIDFKAVLKKAEKDIKNYIEAYNRKVKVYNEKNGTDEKPITKIGDQMVEPIYNELQTEKLMSAISRNSVVFSKDAQPLIDFYLSKPAGSVEALEIFGMGLYSFVENSPFKNAPFIKDLARIKTFIRVQKGNRVKEKNKLKTNKTGDNYVYFRLQFQNRIDGLTKESPVTITNKESVAKMLGIQPQTASLSKSPGLTNLSNAVLNARQPSLSKSPRGMSTFDFDETLIIDGKNFIIAKDPATGEEIQISSGNWPLEGPRYAELGYNFDFKDFVNVRGGVDGPLLQKMKNQIKKFGPNNVFVLTARPPSSATAIHEWLKTKGIKIPLKNITGLGNSTGEAKANWMLQKFSEGYNDMYFVDDALPNVEAVKNALDQLDIKSNVQQAKIKFSNSLDDNFNSILEDVSGIDSKKRYSKSKARKRGEGKGKFRIFVPPSHEDFVGLLYNFIGKGKQGNKHRDFFEKALIKPLNRAYQELNAAKQSIANDYRGLVQQFPDIREKLTKKTPDGDYLYSDAVRVYLWDKFGFEVPGMSKADIKQLSDLVKSDVDLQSFAESIGLISKQKEGYVAPSEHWETGDIRTDLADATGRIGRKQFFAEFIENADIVFSVENLNKIEAIYGKDFRSALEDMLYRTKNGTNRNVGKNKIVNRFLDYLNGSIGATMFFNARSAVLQTLSTVNFINYADNNIFKAAEAFADQDQFWKDFSMIFNSDMLKQRRAGTAFDVNAAELSSEISKSKEPVRAAIRHLLQIGFLPTQIADSFAIALGGASMYRNRVNTYIEQGLSKSEADKKAFTDFQEIAETTQQSARPDKISQQQASPLGRMILAFQNTPSQYVRLMKKAGSDLINRRKTPPYKDQAESDMSNVSKIIYYGAVQNLIFYGLQTAMFAMMFDNDEQDEEFFSKKRDRILNGSMDTILRGMGVGGAVISTIKNTAIKWAENQGKGFGKEDNAVVMEMLQLSPPIGIKARKLSSAEKTYDYNKKVIDEMNTFDIDNPVWSAVGNTVEATTNLPLARLHRKTMNLREAANTENEWWQRLAMAMGWSQWDVGVKNEEVEVLKEKIKQNKKKSKKLKGKKRIMKVGNDYILINN